MPNREQMFHSACKLMHQLWCTPTGGLQHAGQLRQQHLLLWRHGAAAPPCRLDASAGAALRLRQHRNVERLERPRQRARRLQPGLRERAYRRRRRTQVRRDRVSPRSGDIQGLNPKPEALEFKQAERGGASGAVNRRDRRQSKVQGWQRQLPLSILIRPPVYPAGLSALICRPAAAAPRHSDMLQPKPTICAWPSIGPTVQILACVPPPQHTNTCSSCAAPPRCAAAGAVPGQRRAAPRPARPTAAEVGAWQRLQTPPARPRGMPSTAAASHPQSRAVRRRRAPTGSAAAAVPAPAADPSGVPQSLRTQRLRDSLACGMQTITETNRIHLVLFSMQNMTLGPYSAASDGGGVGPHQAPTRNAAGGAALQ
jgi:hypothetical protein